MSSGSVEHRPALIVEFSVSKIQKDISFFRNIIGALLLAAGLHIGMEVIVRDILTKIEEVAVAVSNSAKKSIIPQKDLSEGVCRYEECDRTG